MREQSWLYSNTYRLIRQICSGHDKYSIGLGRTTAWQIEGFPALVQPNLTTQEEVFGYLQVEEVKPVLLETSLKLGGVLIDGLAWNPVALNELETKQVTHCLFRANLYHEDLPVSSFRSLGLYSQTAPYLSGRFNVSAPGAELINLVHVSPVTKKQNCIESISIVTNLRFA